MPELPSTETRSPQHILQRPCSLGSQDPAPNAPGREKDALDQQEEQPEHGDVGQGWLCAWYLPVVPEGQEVSAHGPC